MVLSLPTTAFKNEYGLPLVCIGGIVVSIAAFQKWPNPPFQVDYLTISYMFSLLLLICLLSIPKMFIVFPNYMFCLCSHLPFRLNLYLQQILTTQLKFTHLLFHYLNYLNKLQDCLLKHGLLIFLISWNFPDGTQSKNKRKQSFSRVHGFASAALPVKKRTQ